MARSFPIFPRVLVMGDDLSLGTRAAWGWPEILQTRQPAMTLLNGAKPGQTLLDLYRSLDPLYMPEVRALVLQLPLCDAKGTGVPPEVYVQLVRLTVERCQRIAHTGLVLLPPLCHPHKGQPRSYGRPARRWQSRLREALATVVLPREWTYVTLDLPVEMTSDGVHPTTQGQAFLAVQVEPFLLATLEP